jgi:hypothetical protein
VTAHAVTAPAPLVLDRPRAASGAELAGVMREAVRAWAAVHAHYYGPDVIDAAADLLAGNAVPAAGGGPVTLPPTTVLAYLSLAAHP